MSRRNSVHEHGGLFVKWFLWVYKKLFICLLKVLNLEQGKEGSLRGVSKLEINYLVNIKRSQWCIIMTITSPACDWDSCFTESLARMSNIWGQVGHLHNFFSGWIVKCESEAGKWGGTETNLNNCRHPLIWKLRQEMSRSRQMIPERGPQIGEMEERNAVW